MGQGVRPGAALHATRPWAHPLRPGEAGSHPFQRPAQDCAPHRRLKVINARRVQTSCSSSLFSVILPAWCCCSRYHTTLLWDTVCFGSFLFFLPFMRSFLRLSDVC